VFVFKRPIVKGSVPKKTAYRPNGMLSARSPRANSNATAIGKPVSAPSVRTLVSSSKEQIGVTLWKLRPEQSGETGARLLTMGKQTKDPLKLVAVRVALDESFNKGDKVRVSIESPRMGYLYIVDRELRKDGTLGDPYLIFPTLRTRGGDNRVGAGNVVEVPAQTDNPFYFEITPTEANYAGEMLTVLISPTKINGLVLGDGPIKLDPTLIGEWETKWEALATAFEMEGGLGRKYTEEEKEAGTGARQLTALKNRAFLVSFPLRVSK
jgi:hypothetical protein